MFGKAAKHKQKAMSGMSKTKMMQFLTFLWTVLHNREVQCAPPRRIIHNFATTFNLFCVLYRGKCASNTVTKLLTCVLWSDNFVKLVKLVSHFNRPTIDSEDNFSGHCSNSLHLETVHLQKCNVSSFSNFQLWSFCWFLKTWPFPQDLDDCNDQKWFQPLNFGSISELRSHCSSVKYLRITTTISQSYYNPGTEFPIVFLNPRH